MVMHLDLPQMGFQEYPPILMQGLCKRGLWTLQRASFVEETSIPNTLIWCLFYVFIYEDRVYAIIYPIRNHVTLPLSSHTTLLFPRSSHIIISPLPTTPPQPQSRRFPITQIPQPSALTNRRLRRILTKNTYFACNIYGSPPSS